MESTGLFTVILDYISLMFTLTQILVFYFLFLLENRQIYWYLLRRRWSLFSLVRGCGGSSDHNIHRRRHGEALAVVCHVDSCELTCG